MNIVIYVFFDDEKALYEAIIDLNPPSHSIEYRQHWQPRQSLGDPYINIRQFFNAQKRDFIWPENFSHAYILRIPEPSQLLVVAVQYAYQNHILLAKHKIDKNKYYIATNNEFSSLMNGPEIVISPSVVISPNFKLTRSQGNPQSAQLTLIKDSGSYYMYAFDSTKTSHIRHSRRGTLIVCYDPEPHITLVLTDHKTQERKELITPATPIAKVCAAAETIRFLIPTANEIMNILLAENPFNAFRDLCL